MDLCLQQNIIQQLGEDNANKIPFMRQMIKNNIPLLVNRSGTVH